MKYYTVTIPLALAEKLKEKGMPMEKWQGWATPYISVIEKSEYEWLDKELGQEPSKYVEKRYAVPSYAEVFDWLMEKGYRITIHTLPANEPVLWYGYIGEMEPDYCIVADTRECFSWHEAANAAIEKALTLI